MDVRNCKSCGRLFNYMGGMPLCPQCQKELEEKFHEVKAYLQENEGASVQQVSDAMDVSVKQIRQWIREERLALSTSGADGITCEQCGEPICTGRFCEKCKMQMANTFAGAIERPKKPEIKKKEHDGNRMRFLQ